MTPADIRLHLGLKTEDHDALIEVAILSVELQDAMWGAGQTPVQLVQRIGRVVSDYPEIDRALRMEARNV